MGRKRNLQEELYERQAEICGALASPVRLMILDLLAEQESTAKALQETLKLPKSNLSQHLTVLKRAGLLKVRSEGLYQYLSLALPEIKQACGLLRQLLASRMGQEAELAKALRQKL